MMDKLLSTELCISCFVYIDNDIVFSKTAAIIIEYTGHVLDLVWADNLRIRGLEYYFLLQRI